MTTSFDASAFASTKAKPLPIIFLLDTSDSMNIVVNPDEVVRTGRTRYAEGQLVEYVTGGKSRVDVLNEAVRRMSGTLKKQESQASEFLLSTVTFGGTAALVHSPTPAAEFAYTDLAADGASTPLGSALDVAKQLIEDKEQTPSRAYRPLVVLVSDGEATDSWESKLNEFTQTGRSAKCDRMALGIGEEAVAGRGRSTLEQFVAGTEHQVFEAKDADEIHKFFKFVTMSVVSRSLSQNPNVVPQDATLQPPTPAAASPEVTPGPASPDSPAPSPAATTEDEDSYW